MLRLLKYVRAVVTQQLQTEPVDAHFYLITEFAVRLFLTTGQRFQSHLKYWTIKAGSELACVASVSAPVNRGL